MTVDDLGLLHGWLQCEHIRTSWGKHKTYGDVAAEYLPALEGRERTDL